MAGAGSSFWREEGGYAVHSVAGGFLFGAPFLYTMEVWWRGNIASPARLLSALALTFGALVVIERAANLRSGRRPPWARTVTEAMQAQAFGLVAAAIGLLLVGEATREAGAHALVGRIVMEGLPFGLGVGLADFLLGEAGGRVPSREEEDSSPKDEPAPPAILTRLAATLLGATVLGATLAPTEEIPLIAVSLSDPELLVLVGASLAISYAIVFATKTVTRRAHEEHGAGFRSHVAETVTAYVVSLVAAVTLLSVFGLVALEDPPHTWVAYTIVLGFPASIGGAAGRIAL